MRTNGQFFGFPQVEINFKLLSLFFFLVVELTSHRIEDFGPLPLIITCPYRAFMGRLVPQLVALKKFGMQAEQEPQ
jgi:hypothetical protein